MSCRAIAFAGLVIASQAAHAWQVHLDGSANDVAIGRGGDVVAGGTVDRSTGMPRGVVVALTPSGRVRWRHEYAGRPSGVYDVVVDADGDVFAGGAVRVQEDGDKWHSAVTKLDGRTGVVLWSDPARFDYPGDGVHLESGGDVLTGGAFAVVDTAGGGGIEPFPVLRRLSGADGRERWRIDSAGAPALVDAAHVYTEEHGRIAKRSLADGRVLWQSADWLHDPKRVGDATWDLVGFGAIAEGDVVTRVSGADGTRRWTRSLAELDVWPWPSALAIDAAGAVILAGPTSRRPSGEFDLAIVKLSAVDGSTAWRLTLDGAGPLRADTGWSFLGVERNGNVAIATPMGDRRAGLDGSMVAVLSVRGVDGRLRWYQQLPGVAGKVWALAMSRTGFLAVSGEMYGPTWPGAFMLARLNARTGSGAHVR